LVAPQLFGALRSASDWKFVGSRAEIFVFPRTNPKDWQFFLLKLHQCRIADGVSVVISKVSSRSNMIMLAGAERR
jgi:hypothetical protein